MRKLGVTLVLIWTALNALVAAWVTVRGDAPPALQLVMLSSSASSAITSSAVET